MARPPAETQKGTGGLTAVQSQVSQSPREGQTKWLAGARVVQAIALVALVAYAAHALFGLGGDSLTGLFEDWVYNGVMVAAALLALLRAAVVPAQRLAWAALGCGLAFWVAGGILYTVAPENLDDGPFPAASDLLWLVFYPAAFDALVLMVRSRARVFYGSLWLDGLVGALAVAALTTQFL